MELQFYCKKRYYISQDIIREAKDNRDGLCCCIYKGTGKKSDYCFVYRRPGIRLKCGKIKKILKFVKDCCLTEKGLTFHLL